MRDGHMMTTMLVGRLRLFAAALIVGSAVSLAGTAAAQASDYSVIYNFPAGLAESVVYPTPQGANIWSCRPTADHPQPVVLVPGLTGSMARDWQAAAPLLANNGYCVFAYDFTSEGQESIEAAAAGLSSFVNRVITATGSSTVGLVSHSEGGGIARYYLEFDGGATKTDDLVQISPLNHGTTLYGVGTLANESGLSSADPCAPCVEQTAGSSFMKKLNGHGDTVPGVKYTVIGTRYDEIITPYQSQFLSGAGIQNLLLQNQCSLDAVDHLASQYDSISLRDMLNALDPAHAVAPDCHPVLPGAGG
jgi:triacylglycerol esterase/lipase EstA (alpha/beta hydrolase family)